MDKYLKIGLIAMIAAVVVLPLSLLLKSLGDWYVLAGLVFALLLELIGLVFVILSIIRRKSRRNMDAIMGSSS